jgi:sarcosine oxidase subunit gamma
VSAPEPAPASDAPPRITLGTRPTDVVELAALRNRVHVLKALAGRRGITLPAFGRIAAAGDTLALCVRPERWLLLTAPESPGIAAATWQAACAGCGIAVDLSCALAALQLAGPDTRATLARGCRLDLDPRVFPTGHAAATIMAQVAVIIAALPAGMLILTPASTAQHFREGLAAAARPFGLAPPPADATVTVRSGDSQR